MSEFDLPFDPLGDRIIKLRSRTFEAHVAKPRPPVLFHYTDQVGLLGIMTEGQLWATKVQYMNDSTEFETALDTVDTCVGLALPGMSEGPDKQKLSKLLHLKRGIGGVNIFASCFCVDGDVLSQWRGYGNASGFAIGFEARHLATTAASSRFQLAECIYNKDIQRQIVQELVDACMQTKDASASDLEASICAVGAFFKNHKFAEEQEWRIVSPVTFVTDAAVGFRLGKSMVVPYYKLPLAIQATGAVQSLTIGPCPHPELALSSVRMLAWKVGLVASDHSRGHVEARISEVPYRNW